MQHNTVETYDILISKRLHMEHVSKPDNVQEHPLFLQYCLNFKFN